MKTTFAAHLVPGTSPQILAAADAQWLSRDGAAAPPERSFVCVQGPNARVIARGRYLAAICGHYSVPSATQTPAEWLAQAFEARSTRCFVDINGSWRALIVDLEERAVVAATDRMGSRRVCYSEGPGDRLTIAHDSEVVARIRGSQPGIDPNSLLHYFYFHVVPSPNTLFDGIRCLAPAAALTFDRQGCRQSRYWNPKFANGRADGSRVSPNDLLDALDQSVGAACASAPIATFLSGGLDSSTVLGFASKHLPGAVTPYTIGFDEPAYDETAYARIAADHFGVRVNRYEATPRDVVDVISSVAESYDEPFGNSSAIPTFLCARAAASAGQTQILAGDGGDELFAGNARYRTQEVFSKYLAVPGPLRNNVIEPLFLGALASSDFYPIRKVRRYVEQAKLPMPDRLQTYNFLNVHGVANVFTERFLAAVEPTAPLRHLRDVYGQSSTDCLIDKMLYLDWTLTLADNDLRKVTAMCERADIEVLFPMLDNRLIDICCEIPGRVKMRGGNLRDFYKRAVRPLLPQAIIDKSKHGFGLPFGPWFAKSAPLRGEMSSLLDGLRGRGIVKPEYVDLVRKATLDEHAGYYGEMLWLMCVLESWLSARPAWRSYSL